VVIEFLAKYSNANSVSAYVRVVIDNGGDEGVDPVDVHRSFRPIAPFALFAKDIEEQADGVVLEDIADRSQSP
jgi:hypothetical protein